MNKNEFNWDATIGIHEDGTKEVLSFGKSISDDLEGKARAAELYGVSDIYYVRREDMTDDEVDLVYAAHQKFINRMMQLGD